MSVRIRLLPSKNSWQSSHAAPCKGEEIGATPIEFLVLLKKVQQKYVECSVLDAQNPVKVLDCVRIASLHPTPVR